MFIRNGQALGSVNWEEFAQHQAAQKRPRRAAAKPPPPVEPPDDDEAPKPYDAKPDWVDFAVSKGADRGEAESLTKTELVELYGDEG